MASKESVCRSIQIDSKLTALKAMKLQLAKLDLLEDDMIYKPSKKTRENVLKKEGCELPNDIFLNAYKLQKFKKQNKKYASN